MNRYFIKRCYFCFIPALSQTLSSNSDKEIFDQLEEYDPQPKTGFERVKAIFQPTKDGLMSKEYYSVVQLSTGTFIVGTLVGGMKGATQAHEHFLMEHRSSKFITAYEAQRMMFDHAFLGFVKRGITWGLKCAIFTFLYTGTVVLIAAYRGYDGFLEYCVSGAFAGAFVRAYLGYRAAFAGALLGSTLSTFIGILWYIMTKFGTTPADARQMQYDFMLRRRDKINEVKQRDREMSVQSLQLKRDKGFKDIDNFGYSPNDEDKVFIINKESPKEKSQGIDVLPDLPDEKIS